MAPAPLNNISIYELYMEQVSQKDNGLCSPNNTNDPRNIETIKKSVPLRELLKF
jgi:hypothetical protein